MRPVPDVYVVLRCPCTLSDRQCKLLVTGPIVVTIEILNIYGTFCRPGGYTEPLKGAGQKIKFCHVSITPSNGCITGGGQVELNLYLYLRGSSGLATLLAVDHSLRHENLERNRSTAIVFLTFNCDRTTMTSSGLILCKCCAAR